MYRGHNELDNPSLTQPVMYKVVDNRPSVPDLYTKQLEVCVHVCMCVCVCVHVCGMSLYLRLCTVLQSAEDGLVMTDISQVAASYTDKLNHCFMQTSDYSPPVS